MFGELIELDSDSLKEIKWQIILRKIAGTVQLMLFSGQRHCQWLSAKLPLLFFK